MPLDGKTAIVTGAAAGIGNAIARRFLAEKCPTTAVRATPRSSPGTGVSFCERRLRRPARWRPATR